ncbi:MAG: penicillin-binding protein 2 [Actinomycetota bacterium]|nr:penicillin-binding protein 2 [Actinomycetota bacterium]
MTFSGGQWNRQRRSPVEFQRRVTIIGGVALLAFIAIFFRLWYLQVLSGDKYLAEAQGNQVREVRVQASRGEILDRNGEILVGNRTALALQVRVDELPESEARKERVLADVADVAGMSLKRVNEEIRVQTKGLAGTPVTLKRDVPIELVYYLRENQRRFEGVSVDRVFVRRYPQGTLAAQLFGYVREVDAENLSEPQFQELEPGDQIGKDGVELTYDHVLRGINGVTEFEVDALGLPIGRPTSVREPETGNDLVLTIDSSMQAAGEAALQSFGLPGAFVALDPSNGEVLALGSNPTFNPSTLAQPNISQAESEAVFGDPDVEDSTGAPAFNRAIAGGYPVGSTFKPITALGALDAGKLTTNETILDDGKYELGDGNVLSNAGDMIFGPVQLDSALKVSSDIFFYTLGGRLAEDIADDGEEWIQEWATKLGLGEPTGIDVPGEASGLVPTPEWRNDLYREGLTDRPWTSGDNVNLAVGQGDLQVAPLQIAVAYAAIANDGTVVTPRVALRAEDPAGRVVQEIETEPKRHVDIDPDWRATIIDGLTAAAMEPEGTSEPIFGGYPVDVAGKTGTAETFYQGIPVDQSWYVAWAPADDPQVVVAVTIERGGFGADSAAPAARRIFDEYFDFKPRELGDSSQSTTGEAGTVVYE